MSIFQIPVTTSPELAQGQELQTPASLLHGWQRLNHLSHPAAAYQDCVSRKLDDKWGNPGLNELGAVLRNTGVPSNDVTAVSLCPLHLEY